MPMKPYILGVFECFGLYRNVVYMNMSFILYNSMPNHFDAILAGGGGTSQQDTYIYIYIYIYTLCRSHFGSSRAGGRDGATARGPPGLPTMAIQYKQYSLSLSLSLYTNIYIYIYI